jgi:hypothetical protein
MKLETLCLHAGYSSAPTTQDALEQRGDLAIAVQA